MSIPIRRPCETCKEDTLHTNYQCIHCKTPITGYTNWHLFQVRRARRLVMAGVPKEVAVNIIHSHEKVHAKATREKHDALPLGSLQSGRYR